ncbi:unnamed protein product [Paramecium octaurelia]|uniref:Uncharacterized protein n=1 Tax=Paramecium octaurelia TaxID=43137 RepID=A0A8S1VYB5_PAROT|nr:unnamed protein product [Paramecium octaurelia]
MFNHTQLHNLLIRIGFCIWSLIEQSFKVKQCSDISDQNHDNRSLELCNCIFDGTTCIQKQYCYYFQSNIACKTMLLLFKEWKMIVDGQL